MTAGYYEPGDDEAATRPSGRPGPLPPRTERPPGLLSPGAERPPLPSHSTGPIPPLGAPTAAYPAAPGVPTQPTSGYPALPPPPVTSSAPATAPLSVPAPGSPAAYGGGISGGYPAGSAPVTPGGYATGPVSAAPGGYPPAPGTPVAGEPGRRRSPLVAVLLILLLVVAVGQAVALVVLNGKLDRADRAQRTAQAAADKQLTDLQRRTEALEKQAAASLDPQAVATAVLPSVFKVEAGDFSGTAFVIKSDADGSMLITNFHVVEDLYSGGGRTVSLTHDNQRFSAKIVNRNADDDVALLQTTEKFPALAASHTDVQTGAPIVVVGAPLGLAQSVTTGVVSAIRDDVPGEGGRTYIQFSAPINPGNSGGPVVDAQKEVVGIATAKAQDAEAIGLAIPIAVPCKDFDVC